jgi:hypothetical protein
MAEKIYVAENRTPSIFNQYMATGAKVGLLGALAVTAAVTGGAAAGAPLLGSVGTAWLAGVTGVAAGALVGSSTVIGGARGRRYIEECKTQGRPVSAPTMLNEGLLQGILNGGIMTAAAVTLAAVTGGLGLVPVILGAGTALTAGLGYYQGEKHLQVMSEEYFTAVTAQQTKEQDRGLLGKAKDKLLGTGAEKVTSKDMDIIRSRLEEARKSFQDQVQTSAQEQDISASR